MQNSENPGYEISGMAMLELIWGKGFVAPGGEGNVDRIVNGVDLSGKLVLELGSGIGGGAIVLAGKYGARVLGLEVEGPLVESATKNAANAGLADQIEFRQVAPGEFPVADESMDCFYTSGVLLHFKNKAAAFSQAFRRNVQPPGPRDRLNPGDCRRGGPGFQRRKRMPHARFNGRPRAQRCLAPGPQN